MMHANLLPPATKLGQGYIFRSVCQEFCPQGGGGMCGKGGMCGRRACMAGDTCVVGVCVWQGCVCGGGHAWQILRDMVNERAVRILLECILVRI